MTVLFEGGYTLPSGDLPLKHARILHSGVWKTNNSVTPLVAAASGYDEDALLNSLTYERYKAASGTTGGIEITCGDSNEADCLCIGAHTLGTEGAIISVLSSGPGGSVTHVTAQTITDDGPIMVLFEGINNNVFNVVWTGGQPEIGVVKVGKALQMQQPFYAGFTPSQTNRKTVIRGNISETGEYLGRTKIRTGGEASYSWEHLQADWCDDNLPSLIEGLETEPYFLAWRPGETDDVDFGWTTGPVSNPPTNMGVRNFRSFGFNAMTHGYD